MIRVARQKLIAGQSYRLHGADFESNLSVGDPRPNEQSQCRRNDQKNTKESIGHFFYRTFARRLAIFNRRKTPKCIMERILYVGYPTAGPKYQLLVRYFILR